MISVGYNINGHIVNIWHPISYEVIDRICRPKIYEHFGDDVIFYSDVSN